MATSKVKELADAEAAKAEAEPPTEPTPEQPPQDPDAEPVTEPDEGAAPGEEQPDVPTAEETVKALSRIERSLEAALRDVFQTDEPLVPVPLEGAIGYYMPGALTMRTHDDFRTCPTCNGFGEVLTGSHKNGEQAATCPDANCRGRGYWKREQVPTPSSTMPQPQAAPANGAERWEQPAWLGDPTISAQPPVNAVAR